MTTNSHAAPWTFRQFMADVFARPTNLRYGDIRGRSTSARRIAEPNLPLSERFILRHWGYTPAEWAALPNEIRTAKRSGYFQAVGL